MQKLPKLKLGDKVAVLSPSWCGPAVFPHVYELGIERLRTVFGLELVEYPTTRKQGTAEERSRDIVAAFQGPEIKGAIATIGGNDQVTYVKKLPQDVFAKNPKPFFGYSDNSHLANHLWLAGVPSYYGGSILTQLAMQGEMDPLTVEYLRHAYFDEGEYELTSSATYNDIGLDWGDASTLHTRRTYEPNKGWVWDGTQSATGPTWGGCIESVDEMLRHGVPIPSLKQFENVILMFETSEEIPFPEYVRRIYRALGERGILERIKGVLVGRPKAWEFNKQHTTEEKRAYTLALEEMTVEAVRTYNKTAPIIQNMDFGHTDPQIAMPYGGQVRIDAVAKKVFATY